MSALPLPVQATEGRSGRQGRGQVAGDFTDPSSLLHTVFTHFLHL